MSCTLIGILYDLTAKSNKFIIPEKINERKGKCEGGSECLIGEILHN